MHWYNNAIKFGSTAGVIRTRELHEESSDALLLELVVSTGLGIGGRCPRGKPVLCMRELNG